MYVFIKYVTYCIILHSYTYYIIKIIDELKYYFSRISFEMWRYTAWTTFSCTHCTRAEHQYNLLTTKQFIARVMSSRLLAVIDSRTIHVSLSEYRWLTKSESMQQKMDCEFDVADRTRRSGLSYKYATAVGCWLLRLHWKFFTELYK